MRMKLDGLRWNNIDLSKGLPEDVIAKCANPQYEEYHTARAIPMENNLYIAQHNFIDLEPVGITSEGALPLLPGQPMSHAPAEINVGKATHAVVSATNLQGLIAAATDPLSTSALFDDVDMTANFLNSFTRSGVVYTDIGNLEHVSGNIMRWVGWGITYYTGLVRPTLVSQYPPLSIGQMPVVFPGNNFVIDYTKTSLTFDFSMSTGDVFLLDGQIG